MYYQEVTSTFDARDVNSLHAEMRLQLQMVSMQPPQSQHTVTERISCIVLYQSEIMTIQRGIAIIEQPLRETTFTPSRE